MQIIQVGMAQLDIAKSPVLIETMALGSCVGVVLYDSVIKIGGISHAMLPDIKDAKTTSRNNPAKFVNTAIIELIKKMEKAGASKKLIKAKIAGGANMFPNISKTDSLHIGKRNVNAAKAKLMELSIPVIAEDTGGSFGRTITLDTNTGLLKIKTLSLGEKEI